MKECVGQVSTDLFLDALHHAKQLLTHLNTHFILPHDTRARRLFVTSGGLKKVQEIQAEPGSMLLEYIQIINCCFPEEIVRYYSPGYPDNLLEAVEQYQPKCSSLFILDEHLSSETDSKSSLSSQMEEG